MAPGLIDRYEIRGELGSGGMGRVFRAFDPVLQREVAIKMVHPENLDSPDAKARFIREAQTAATVTNPSVVQIFDVVEIDENTYIVMELIEGDPLSVLFEGNKIVISEACGILQKVAEGLAAAHAKNVIHRDIKAQNVMVTPTGEVKILDFGLATKISPEVSAMTTKKLMGTLYYMSPEQLNKKRAGPKSDLFSFGVLAYRALSGKWPFLGETYPEIHLNISRNPHTPLRLLDERISQDLSDLVDQLLAKEPDLRPKSAGEVAARLSELALLQVGDQPRGRMAALTTRALGSARLEQQAPLERRWWRQHGAYARVMLVLSLIALVVLAVLLRPFRDPPTVAILGFIEDTANEESPWVSTALSEIIREHLAAGGEIRTVGGERLAEIAQDLELSLANLDLEALKRHLEVDWIVLGSYGKESADGDARGILEIRLLESVTGEVDWRETFAEGSVYDQAVASAAGLRRKLGAAALSAEWEIELGRLFPAETAASVRYFQGLDHLRRFKPYEAEVLFVEAIELEPEHPAVHTALAAALFETGYEAEANAAARRAVELASDLPRRQRLELKGRQYEIAEQWNEATSVYSDLLGKYPDVDYGMRLAEAQSLAGRPKDALVTLDFLRRQQALPPRDEARLLLPEARARMALGQAEEARTVGRLAVTMADALEARFLASRARLELAVILDTLGDFEQALRVLEEASRGCAAMGYLPGMKEAFELMALIHAEYKDLEKARHHLRLFLDDYPEPSEALNTVISLCNVLDDLGRPLAGKALLEETVTFQGQPTGEAQQAQVEVALGAATQSLGDLVAARQHFEEALRLFELLNDQVWVALTWTNIGEVLFLAGDLDGSQEFHERALAFNREFESDAGTAYDLYRLGKISAARGEFVAAGEAYREARGLWEGIEDSRTLARLQLAEAELEAHRQNLGLAVDLAAQTEAFFWKNGLSDAATLAQAFRATQLLKRGDSKAAQGIATEADHHAAESESRLVRLTVGVLRARIRAIRGDVEGALEGLQNLELQAESAGYAGFVWEVRLTAGEIELEATRGEAVRKKLETLADQASQQGFDLVADTVRRLLDRVPKLG